MIETLRATEAQRQIFDEIFDSLSSLDSLYWDDSKAVIAQRKMYEERLAESQAALERIDEIAGKREKELFNRRRELGRAALNLYSNYPEVEQDRSRTFALAVQLSHGISMEERDLSNAVRGLLAIDNAVKDNQPIVQLLNGQFRSLIVPEREANGLTLDIKDYEHGSSGLDIAFYIPTAMEVHYESSYRQFPSRETYTRESIQFTSQGGELRSQRGFGSMVAATIASNYDVSHGVKQQGKAELEADGRQTMYILGEDLIQKAITNSTIKTDTFWYANPEFAYNTWLAGKLVDINFDCDLRTISEQILHKASVIIENTAKSYTYPREPELGSDIANILLEAVREIGAEDQLFETFAASLAKQGSSEGSIYRNPEVARILFDSIMSKSPQA